MACWPAGGHDAIFAIALSVESRARVEALWGSWCAGPSTDGLGAAAAVDAPSSICPLLLQSTPGGVDGGIHFFASSSAAAAAVVPLTANVAATCSDSVSSMAVNVLSPNDSGFSCGCGGGSGDKLHAAASLPSGSGSHVEIGCPIMAPVRLVRRCASTLTSSFCFSEKPSSAMLRTLAIIFAAGAVSTLIVVAARRAQRR
jgi:hypothetical protein